MKQVSIMDTLSFIYSNKMIFILGGFVGVAVLIIISSIVGFFGVPLHPFTMGFFMTITYTGASAVTTIPPEKQFVFIREAMCYWIATMLILFLIGFPPVINEITMP